MSVGGLVEETEVCVAVYARELGHPHVDFVREGRGWKLDNIWLCR